MWRGLIVAGFILGMAAPAFAEEPDSLVAPARRRPTATTPT